MNNNKRVEPDEMMPLPVGPKMDQLFSDIALGKKSTRGRVPAYSSDLRLATAAIELLPVGVGKSQMGDQLFVEDRPYWAGHPDYAFVTSASPALALCKAAILIAMMIEERKAQLINGSANDPAPADEQKEEQADVTAEG